MRPLHRGHEYIDPNRFKSSAQRDILASVSRLTAVRSLRFERSSWLVFGVRRVEGR